MNEQMITYAPYLKWVIKFNKLNETLNSNQVILKLNWLHADINMVFFIKRRIEFSIQVLSFFSSTDSEGGVQPM